MSIACLPIDMKFPITIESIFRICLYEVYRLSERVRSHVSGGKVGELTMVPPFHQNPVVYVIAKVARRLLGTTTRSFNYQRSGKSEVVITVSESSTLGGIVPELVMEKFSAYRVSQVSSVCIWPPHICLTGPRNWNTGRYLSELPNLL